MLPTEYVILVDAQDRETGTMEKLEAHRQGLLHRAFSVFVFNSQGQLLLQQRALHKYHSAGLWTNTCCSHPRPGESAADAAHRRLREEMGMDCKLHFKDTFIYKTPFENGLTEYELDHVFMGQSNTQPVINPEEVAAFAWETPEQIRGQMAAHPGRYTTWFRIAMEQFF